MNIYWQTTQEALMHIKICLLANKQWFKANATEHPKTSRSKRHVDQIIMKTKQICKQSKNKECGTRYVDHIIIKRVIPNSWYWGEGAFNVNIQNTSTPTLFLLPKVESGIKPLLQSPSDRNSTPSMTISLWCCLVRCFGAVI